MEYHKKEVRIIKELNNGSPNIVHFIKAKMINPTTQITDCDLKPLY